MLKQVALIEGKSGSKAVSVELVEAKATETLIIIKGVRYRKVDENWKKHSPSMLARKDNGLLGSYQVHEVDSDYVQELIKKMRRPTLIKNSIEVLKGEVTDEQLEAIAKILGLDKPVKFIKE